MDIDKLKQQWLDEENAVLTGWDFSRLDKKTETAQMKWDYTEVVKRHLKPVDMLLDMGTGGGERLFEIGHPYHLTHVTEGYPPNVELCRKNLVPLGIGVKQVFSDILPFENEMFDVVINRHSSFDIFEVWRVLKPRGVFITQQVGGENDRKLMAALGYENQIWPHSLRNNINKVERQGFEVIEEDEYFQSVKYFDVADVVFFAKAIMWEFPGFSVESHLPQLIEIQKQIDSNGYFEDAYHRFIIVGRKK